MIRFLICLSYLLFVEGIVNVYRKQRLPSQLLHVTRVEYLEIFNDSLDCNTNIECVMKCTDVTIYAFFDDRGTRCSCKAKHIPYLVTRTSSTNTKSIKHTLTTGKHKYNKIEWS